MSTPAEDLSNALAHTGPVLYGWEIHVLTSIVWTPQVLNMFVERLRPEVLKLAHDIVHVLECDCTDYPCSPAARDFVAAVDKAWPEMARRRT